MCGDFNAYSSALEKKGGGLPDLLSIASFNGCIQEANLIDLGFFGYPYTWEARGVKERPDQCLCNTIWLLSFPQSSVTLLPTFKLDHKPILVHLSDGQNCSYMSKPFRLLINWLYDPSFAQVVN